MSAGGSGVPRIWAGRVGAAAQCCKVRRDRCCPRIWHNNPPLDARVGAPRSPGLLKFLSGFELTILSVRDRLRRVLCYVWSLSSPLLDWIT